MCDLLVLKNKINLSKTSYSLLLIFIVYFLMGCEADQEGNLPVSFPNDIINSANESKEPIRTGTNDEGGRTYSNQPGCSNF